MQPKQPKRIPRTILIGAACAVGAVAAFAWRRARALDMHLPRLASGRAIVFTETARDGSPVRVLSVGGAYQSATYLDERRFEPAFAYYRAFDVMFETARPPARILVIGGGGHAYPKHVLAAHAPTRIDVVEIDPAVTDIARRWFFLDEAIARFDPCGERLGIVEGDGRRYLEAFPNANAWRYDAIVNDAFAGRQPVSSLLTAEAARAAKRCLAPGGLYLANVVSAGNGTDVGFLRSVAATLRSAFAHVHVIPSSDEDFGGEDNYLVIATDASRAFPRAIAYDESFLGEVLHDGADRPDPTASSKSRSAARAGSARTAEPLP